jgi:hypothetical protein
MPSCSSRTQHRPGRCTDPSRSIIVPLPERSAGLALGSSPFSAIVPHNYLSDAGAEPQIPSTVATTGPGAGFRVRRPQVYRDVFDVPQAVDFPDVPRRSGVSSRLVSQRRKSGHMTRPSDLPFKMKLGSDRRKTPEYERLTNMWHNVSNLAEK